MGRLLLREGNKVTRFSRLPRRKIMALAKNFYSDSPLTRFLMRCRRARKQMLAYREMKMIRRPRRFRQDVW
jgi:hypothetical protein